MSTQHAPNREQGSSDLSSQDPTPAGDAFALLTELHINILSAAGVVKQMQTEFARLKQENERLRKDLLSSTGEKQALRMSARPVGPLVANWAISAPSANAKRPKTPTEPEKVLPFISDGRLEGPRHSHVSEAPFIEKEQLKRNSTISSFHTKALTVPQGQTVNRNSTNTLVSSAQFNASPSNDILRNATFDPNKRKKSERVWFHGFHDRDSDGFESHQGARMMLSDPHLLKQQVRKNIVKPDTSITRYYHKQGYAQRIARSQVFESIQMLAIFLNTIWIAIDTEHNNADVLIAAPPAFQIIEHSWCLYFVSELAIRFAAFMNKSDCLRSGEFVFDMFLVIVMVFEDWVMSAILLLTTDAEYKSIPLFKNAAVLRGLRLLRLARLGRAVKLMRQSPEVMIMVKALAASLRCVIWTCVLLACMMFFFGVGFTQLCKDTALEKVYFPSLTKSLHTLMIAGLFPDLETISTAIRDVHPLYWLLFMTYLMMTTITVLNLLIGVLVEVAQASARTERDAMDVAYVKEVFISTLHLNEVEDVGSLYICKEEFAELLHEPDILKALTKVGIDIFGLIDLLDFTFVRGSLGFAEVLEAVLQLRSSANVTVRDLVEVRKFLSYEMTKMKQELSYLTQGVKTSNDKASEVIARVTKSKTGFLSHPSSDFTQTGTSDTEVNLRLADV